MAHLIESQTVNLLDSLSALAGDTFTSAEKSRDGWQGLALIAAREAEELARQLRRAARASGPLQSFPSPAEILERIGG